ncbi:Putative transcriptional regulator%2C MerR family [Mycobacteroides abscessus]|nr:MerR family transcriptional regulator [Mycobacteroides abscessus]RIT43061.1 MerR family transcriptional regulator [Mycobacteroides abscessus]CPT41725.1 Putative transcriptional regulator%2C MerR family [Mycobacteroides abscessus]CPU45066.1 Putative transcriptional regulator%2C MerR family [Mycobacteroides abscessus]SKK62675.1 Putative transcriptional regulator, MerR family [Mycobacteroides abscessus subsp. massiliense]SKO95632.1 MerR family transcriptional regulator [Mycobacteroides abscess
MPRSAITEPTVNIGEAAALYDLAPSTLRWWEKQGVLSSPAQHSGRRTYTERDLRCIGIAYLCCITGMMPLRQAAIVTSHSAQPDTWRSAVTEQVAEISARIERLHRARDYLNHLLCCQNEDIVDCPYLDGELRLRTPRGRAGGTDLVSAARGAGYESAPARDETAAGQPGRCGFCGGQLSNHSKGRPQRYCSPACKQRAYRHRHGMK